MKVVVAIDSFKGSMTSMEARNGCKGRNLKSNTRMRMLSLKPLADGGEGTTDALIAGLGGERIDLTVTGPLGTPVNAHYGYLAEKNTAILEMAAAAGIILVRESEKNPLTVTTYGVGEMIADAMERGIRNFIIGIGGSATNDGGIGMLKALGYQFSDENGQDVGEGGQALERVSSIIIEKANPILKECSFHIACDVTNPLCGKNGATYIYGPQKGVTPEIAEELDQAMNHYASVTSKFLHNDYASAEGAGAAGGLGFAFLSYLNATLTPGIDLILNAVELEKELEDTDITVTGEGRSITRPLWEKLLSVWQDLQKNTAPKSLLLPEASPRQQQPAMRPGIDAFFPIVRGITTLAEAMDPKNAKSNMAAAVEQVFRLL